MRRIGQLAQSSICLSEVSTYIFYKKQEAQHNNYYTDPQIPERPNAIAKATRSLDRHKTTVGSLYQKGSREGRTSNAVPLETMQVYIGSVIPEGQAHIYSSSPTSNNLQVLDVEHSLRHIGTQEGTYRTAREITGQGSITHYRSIQKCANNSLLEGSRHPTTINIYIKPSNAGSTNILGLASLLVYLGLMPRDSPKGSGPDRSKEEGQLADASRPRATYQT